MVGGSIRYGLQGGREIALSPTANATAEVVFPRDDGGEKGPMKAVSSPLVLSQGRELVAGADVEAVVERRRGVKLWRVGKVVSLVTVSEGETSL